MPVRMIRVANPPSNASTIRVYPRKKGGEGYTYLYQGKWISEGEAKRLAQTVPWTFGAGVASSAMPKPLPSPRSSTKQRSPAVAKSKKKKSTKKAKKAKKTVAAAPAAAPKRAKKAKQPRPWGTSPGRKGQKAVKKVQVKKGAGGTYKVFASKRTRPKSGGTTTTYHMVRYNSPVKQLTESLKRGGMLYAGLLSVRVANGLIKEHVVGVQGTSGLLKNAASDDFLAKAAPYIPGLATFLAGAFLAPRLPISKDWQSVIQAGGAVALFDSVMTNAIIPKLTTNSDGTAKSSDDFTVKLAKYLGVGDGPNELAYYPQPGPVAYYPDQPGLGADPYAVPPRRPFGRALWVTEN